MRCVSLRSVISLVAALSVAIVAGMMLGIILTTSLAALRDVGSGQASALLRGAQLGATHMFSVPQDALEAQQRLVMQGDWEWPANSATSCDRWQTMQRTLLMESHGRLFNMLSIFRDSSSLAVYSLYEGAREAGDEPPLLAETVLMGTPVNATSPQSTVNQSGLPLQARLLRTDSWSAIPPSDARFARNIPNMTWIPLVGGIKWDGPLLLTTGGRHSANGGIFASLIFGVPENMFLFVAPMHRRGEVPGVDEPFAFTYAGLLFQDLDQLLLDTKATSGTLAVALERHGFLLASSSAAEKPVTTVSRVSFGTAVGVGCTTSQETDDFAVNKTVVQICRAQATDYGHAGLTAVLQDSEFAFDDRQIKILSTDNDGVFFAGVAKVPIRFRGISIHLAVLIPEVDVIGDVVRSQNLAIGITCAVFVFVAAVIFAAISLLLSPLHTIAARMQRAAHFDDDAADESVSAMAEVAALQEAYYAMNDELNRIRSFVPQAVLVASNLRKEAVDDDIESDVESTTAPSHTPSLSITSQQQRRRRSGKSAGATSLTTSVRGGESSATAIDVGFERIALPVRSVAVLVANLDGFSAATCKGRRQPSTRTCETLAAAMSHVEAAIAANRGVLGGFHGDHFTVSFNAVRSCAAAPRRACSTAWALAQAQLGDPGNPAGIPGAASLRFRVGVAYGKCQLGHTGTVTAKTFSIVGPAFTQAGLLERLSRLYGPECRVLTTARVCQHVATHFRHRVLDHVLLPPRTPTLIAAIVGPVSRDEGAGNADAWLYVFGGDGVDADANAAHNAAFQHFARGDLTACEDAVAGSAHGAAREAMTPASDDAVATFVGIPVIDDEDTVPDARDTLCNPLRRRVGGLHDNLAPLIHALRAAELAADDASDTAGYGGRRRVGGDAPVTALTNLHDAFLRDK